MLRPVVILVLAAALASCGGGKAPPAKKKKAAPTEIEALAALSTSPGEEAPQYEYAYSPVGKRDPFRSVLDDPATRQAAAVARPECGPLCNWELDQLKLVAVVSGISNPVAMLEAPGRRGYIVRRGSFVGKRNGRVTQIRAGEVVITEIFKDQMGKPHVNPVVISLPADRKEAENLQELNLLGAEVAE